jgi:predicted PurR-regulated permease PerM
MNEIIPKAKASQILLTIAAFVIVVAGMRASEDILVPFLLAAFIAIISAPPLFWLQSKGLPGWLALLVVILSIFFVGFLMAWLVGSSVKDFSNDLPIYEEKLRQQTTVVLGWLARLGMDTSDLGLTQIFNPGAAMKLVAAGLNSLGNVLANGFLSAMTVIFMLLEATAIAKKLQSIVGDRASSMTPFENFISNVKNYMAIKTLVSLGTGILVAIWIFIMGVDYPLLWGMLAFALNYVPNIGSIIAAVPAVLLAIIQVGFFKAMIIAVGYIVVNVVIGSVIEPRFMGRGLGLSTLVVFLSLLFWGWVLGPVGMLLSVPLTITAKIALDSREESRWIAVLLGPESGTEKLPKDSDGSTAGENGTIDKNEN